MAVTAIYAVVADMVFMAKGNRLIAGDIYIRGEGSRVEFVSGPNNNS
jgi:hypothetical protein